MRVASMSIIITSIMGFSKSSGSNLRAAASRIPTQEHDQKQWNLITKEQRKLVWLQNRNPEVVVSSPESKPRNVHKVQAQLKKKEAQNPNSHFGVNIVGGEESDDGEFPYFGTLIIAHQIISQSARNVISVPS